MTEDARKAILELALELMESNQPVAAASALRKVIGSMPTPSPEIILPVIRGFSEATCKI